MPDVTLYDTRTRTLQPFSPRDPSRVGIYACGPTVYGRVHVGNARPFIVFSQLKRFLVHEGYGVTLVGNITDINDKIYDAAKKAGRPSAELAAEMAEWYIKDTDRLGLGRPDAEPFATEYIDQIIELIARLIEGGSAYACEGDVYFRVRTLPNYGELSRRDVDQMDQGEGVEGADLKEDPLDFALWKAWKEGEDTSWDAPWGRGRPGWHIECSAMAEALLGVEFDIHGGGVDLVFPHHENEAAQTFAAPRQAAGADLDAQRDARARPRRRCRSPWATSAGSARCSTRSTPRSSCCSCRPGTTASRWRSPTRRWRTRAARPRASARRGGGCSPGPSPAALEPYRDAFFAALRNDFNTAEALASLYGWIREANRSEEAVGNAHLVEMLDVLGLVGLIAAEEGAPPEAVALAEQRETARREKNWAEADRLRDELRALGWEVRDGPDGPELVRT